MSAPDAKTPADPPQGPDPVLPLAELLKQQPVPSPAPPPVAEIGGRRDGPEPTRYGDWEKNGRCIDF
ncbi:DUF1674 domain-containing protein [Solimonas aquatica]|uniref:DUF1674 domain-containing protein n=1 Tax=Solimonas aquatica TaxID=489703 RepID=UPI000B85CA72